MTQIATVEKILDSQHAIISVPRKSACGHDCEECAGCGISGTAIRAKAINTVGAKIGQKVVVESSTEKMLGIVALVYLTPIVLFFAGYITMLLLNFSVAVQYTVYRYRRPPPYCKSAKPACASAMNAHGARCKAN